MRGLEDVGGAVVVPSVDVTPCEDCVVGEADVVLGAELVIGVELGRGEDAEPEVIGSCMDELPPEGEDEARGVQVTIGSVVSAIAAARMDCCSSYQDESDPRNLSPVGPGISCCVDDDWLLELLEELELLDWVAVEEAVSVVLLEVLSSSPSSGPSTSAGPGLGPPAAGGPPPGGVGGFHSQQRPQLAPLPPSDPQNSGTTQSEPVSQSGPVHIQAHVGLMSPELVYVGVYVTGVVLPDFDTGMTVAGYADVDEPVVAVSITTPRDPLELVLLGIKPDDDPGSKGAEVLAPLVIAGVMLLLELDIVEDEPTGEEPDEDEPDEKGPKDEDE